MLESMILPMMISPSVFMHISGAWIARDRWSATVTDRRYRQNAKGSPIFDRRPWGWLGVRVISRQRGLRVSSESP
jgi:hypothetical protein